MRKHARTGAITPVRQAPASPDLLRRHGWRPLSRRPARRIRSSPEVLEPARRQLGVSHRVLDVAVAEVSLQRSGIVALVGQRKAAGVPQHVWG